MEFVNEYIPVADKIWINLNKIKHPLHGDPFNPNKWSIDRKRDIALISLGVGFGKNAQFLHFFVLYWQGETINLFLRSKFIVNYITSDLEVTWHLELSGKQIENMPEDEVIATLKEALFTYGYIGGLEARDKIKAVHFDGKHLRGR